MSEADDGQELERARVLTPPPVRREPGSSHEAPVLSPARYVLLPLAQMLTGYSVKAMQRKIERGDWQEGKVWRRAPDGRILIDLAGYERWVERV